MFYIAIVILAGLALTAKDGIDRIIYSTLAAAAVTAFFHLRGIPGVSQ